MIESRWKLRSYLAERNLSPHRLARAIPGMRQATVYRLAAEDAPQSVSFEVLARIVGGLRQLTGEDVTANDLIEMVEARTAEDEAWLGLGLQAFSELEPYDWGEVDPQTVGQPVRLTHDGRLVVSE